MSVIYIALGIMSGIIAAATAWMAGSGMVLAMVAYLIAGLVSILMGAMWVAAKRSLNCRRSDQIDISLSKNRPIFESNESGSS